MATTFYGVRNNAKTTITNNPLTAGGLSITLASSSGAKFPTGAFLATIWNASDYPDPGDDSNMEIVLCDSRSGDTVTVNASGRGYAGTTGVEHATGSAFRILMQREHIDQITTAVNALETSKALLVGSSPVVMASTPFTNVLSLNDSSTVSDTDLDLTASTSATATHVILKVFIASNNITNATYVGFRKKGDTYGNTTSIDVYAPPANNYIVQQVVIVPMDSEQRITYRVNANASSTDIDVWVMGYLAPAIT